MMNFRGIGDLEHCFDGHVGYYGGFMHSGWGIVMMIGALIAAALVIFLIVTLVRRARRNRPSSQDSQSLELLKERFAKGEITEEDFSRMKKILSDK